MVGPVQVAIHETMLVEEAQTARPRPDREHDHFAKA
jgi:hypothetical protein